MGTCDGEETDKETLTEDAAELTGCEETCKERLEREKKPTRVKRRGKRGKNCPPQGGEGARSVNGGRRSLRKKRGLKKS